MRNADPGKYSPETAGYIGFGDQSGAKQSADRTWLADAAEHGARDDRQLPRAEDPRPRAARAAGVEAVWTAPDRAASAAVTVKAPRVVVACGSLESPALLLRSEIGGPAAGDYLRLHPTTVTSRPLRRGPEGVVGRSPGRALRRVRRHRRRLRRS